MIRNAVAACLLLALLVRAAGAVTIQTPPLHFPGKTVACTALKNSDRDISGTITLYDQAGVAFATGPLDVPAHNVRGVSLLPVQSGAAQGFCRFAGAFSRKDVKLTLCAVEVGDLICSRAVYSD